MTPLLWKWELPPGAAVAVTVALLTIAPSVHPSEAARPARGRPEAHVSASFPAAGRPLAGPEAVPAGAAAAYYAAEVACHEPASVREAAANVLEEERRPSGRERHKARPDAPLVQLGELQRAEERRKSQQAAAAAERSRPDCRGPAALEGSPKNLRTLAEPGAPSPNPCLLADQAMSL